MSAFFHYRYKILVKVLHYLHKEFSSNIQTLSITWNIFSTLNTPQTDSHFLESFVRLKNYE